MGLVTAGGRVLTVVGTGSTLLEARERAYRGVEAVRFEGRQFRTDIGLGPSRLEEAAGRR